MADAVHRRASAVRGDAAALSLETAGRDLSRSEGLSQLVVVTDGMETCEGIPARSPRS